VFVNAGWTNPWRLKERLPDCGGSARKHDVKYGSARESKEGDIDVQLMPIDGVSQRKIPSVLMVTFTMLLLLFNGKPNKETQMEIFLPAYATSMTAICVNEDTTGEFKYKNASTDPLEKNDLSIESTNELLPPISIFILFTSAI
jgi:hypothetical protein